MKTGRKNAFSMAEAIMVLVLIGTVVGITIPTFLHNHRESEIRTKIKKSAALYESVFKRLAVDNNCLSDSCMNRITCENRRRVFAVIEIEEDDNSCIFRTSDNVWWNMTDITNPVVATQRNKLGNLDDADAAYMFSGHVESGVLRINDSGGNLSPDERAQLNRLFQFIRR